MKASNERLSGDGSTHSPGDTVGHSEVVTPKALLCPHKFCRAQKKFF